MRVLRAVSAFVLAISLRGLGSELSAAEMISLTAPSGGQTWAVDSPHYITWKPIGKGTVKLEYTTDDGQKWVSIAAAAPNTSSTFSTITHFS